MILLLCLFISFSHWLFLSVCLFLFHYFFDFVCLSDSPRLNEKMEVNYLFKGIKPTAQTPRIEPQTLRSNVWRSIDLGIEKPPSSKSQAFHTNGIRHKPLLWYHKIRFRSPLISQAIEINGVSGFVLLSKRSFLCFSVCVSFSII